VNVPVVPGGAPFAEKLSPPALGVTEGTVVPVTGGKLTEVPLKTLKLAPLSTLQFWSYLTRRAEPVSGIVIVVEAFGQVTFSPLG
jgi:hypothetical protein